MTLAGFIALLTACIGFTGALLGAYAAVTQFRKLRDENRTQHAEGQIANETRWALVMESLGNVHGTVEVTREEQAEGFAAVHGELAEHDKRLASVETVVNA